jgi:hypothetical protein
VFRYLVLYFDYCDNISSKHIRYGLVARICRSHCSADKAGVQFPVSENFLFAVLATATLFFGSLVHGDVAVVMVWMEVSGVGRRAEQGARLLRGPWL